MNNYNLDPNIWGHAGWKIIYAIGYGYPDNPTLEEQVQVYNYFTSLSYLLPCGDCRNHYKDNLLKYPLINNVIRSRTSLLNWINTVHNDVNIRLHKQPITLNDALNKYISNDNKYIQNNKQYSFIKNILILIILLLIVVKVHRTYN